MSENIAYGWDEFVDWCEDEGISLTDNSCWEPWWACWKAAIDAKNPPEPPEEVDE